MLNIEYLDEIRFLLPRGQNPIMPCTLICGVLTTDGLFLNNGFCSAQVKINAGKTETPRETLAETKYQTKSFGRLRI